MFAQNTALALLACLLLFGAATLAQQRSVGIQTFRKELTDPYIIATYNDTINGHPRLSYVKSDRNTYADGKPVFVLVVETYVEGITFRKSCWTNISSTDKENVRLFTLENDQVVLFWTELVTLLKIHLVDVKSCEWKNVTEVRVDLPPTRSFDRSVFVVPYGNVFDVMYSNLDTCKKRLCKMSFDCDGNANGELSVLEVDIYDPSLSLSSSGSSQHFPHFTPISRDDPTKGYFVLLEEGDQLKIKTLDSRGSVSNAQIVHVEPQALRNGRPFVISNAHETFGYCWILVANKTINCYQYDSALNVKTNLTWTIGYYVSTLSMHNLLAGGFILLTKDAPYGSQYMTMVESDGRRSDSIELRDHDCPVMLYEKMIDSFYCSYGLCWNKSSNSLTTDIRCVRRQQLLMN